MPKIIADISEHRFISFDRTPIFYRLVSPGPNALATLVVVHGMGEHGGRYVDLANYLASEGYQVVIPDLRGFGQSGGLRGCVRSFKDYYQDLDALMGAVRPEISGRKSFLLGHSFGGLISFHYAAERQESRLSGLILSSPNFGLSISVPKWRHWIACAMAYLLPDLTQANRVNPTYLSHDKKSVLRYRTDKLIHAKISARLYRELTAYMSKCVSVANRFGAPVLVLQAGDEKIVSRPQTEKVFEAILADDKTLEIYEGFYHEILNEENSGIVYERILSWLDRQIKI